MSENVTDILSRFRAPPSGEAAERLKPETHNKREYRAADPFLKNEARRRIRIVYNNGDEELLQYSLMLSVTAHGPKRVSLIFSTGAVMCKGVNLLPLLDLLQAEEIKVLRPFDGRYYEEPDPENDTIIDTIEWTDPRKLPE